MRWLSDAGAILFCGTGLRNDSPDTCPTLESNTDMRDRVPIANKGSGQKSALLFALAVSLFFALREFLSVLVACYFSFFIFRMRNFTNTVQSGWSFPLL